MTFKTEGGGIIGQLRKVECQLHPECSDAQGVVILSALSSFQGNRKSSGCDKKLQDRAKLL